MRVLDNPRRATRRSGSTSGSRNARGDYIARMDAHTLYPEDYLARGVARLRRGGADHVSGPQLAARRRHLVAPGGARARHAAGPRRAQFRQCQRTGEIEVDSGFTGVWPRSVLEAHSGWDEGWPNDQDSELAARIRGGGGRIVCLPEMGAQYIPRDILKALARQYWRYGFYRAKTSGAHPESMRRSHLLARSLALVAGGRDPAARRASGVSAAWLSRRWCATVVGVAMAEAWRADSAVELDATAGGRGRACRRSSAPCTSPGASASCSAASASGRRCGRLRAPRRAAPRA